jgi:LPS-assembly lipoprotein
MSSSEARNRRRRLLAAAPLLALAGCGFQLKGTAELHFGSIALAGFAPRSPLADELSSTLARSVTVLPAPDKADVVLQALVEQRLRRAAAFTASGQVRDIQLRTIFKYAARTPAERELLAPSQIELYREMTYVEAKTLGKEQEEQALYREMQSDIVRQVMLRLSTIRL